MRSTRLALADDTGAVQTTYTYEPFGASTVTGQTNTNSYQYTGLDYYRARYYSPTRQRFISEDPIGFNGRSPNLYEYVNGAPISYKDALGLESVKTQFGLGVAVSIKYGTDSEGSFFEVIAGLGLGAGSTYDPIGGFSPPDSQAIGYSGYGWQWGAGYGAPGISESNIAAAVATIPPAIPYSATWNAEGVSFSPTRRHFGASVIGGWAFRVHNTRFDRATAGRGNAYPPRRPPQ
jgi:RHS repeat-associated protein